MNDQDLYCYQLLRRFVPCVLYGFETWSVIVRVECVWEQRVLQDGAYFNWWHS